MKITVLVPILLLTCTTCFSQVSGCFQKKSRYYKSILTLNNKGVYLHKIVLTGDHTLTSFEKGYYTIKGDSILFRVAEYGVDENELQPQIGNLVRKGIMTNKAIRLFAKSGESHEKLRKAKCRQRPLWKAKS